jgi:hypothetical protein
MKTLARLQKIVTLLVIFIAFACTGNEEGCQCGTRETKVKPYRGDLKATKPYGELEKFSVMQQGDSDRCTGGACTYSVMARYMIHNPTEEVVVADVVCRFWLDKGQYEVAKNQRLGIKIPKRSSRGTEIQELAQVTPGKRAELGASCVATFHDDYNSGSL